MKLTQRISMISIAATAAVLFGAGGVQAQGDGGHLPVLGTPNTMDTTNDGGGTNNNHNNNIGRGPNNNNNNNGGRNNNNNNNNIGGQSLNNGGSSPFWASHDSSTSRSVIRRGRSDGETPPSIRTSTAIRAEATAGRPPDQAHHSLSSRSGRSDALPRQPRPQQGRARESPEVG
ncbi:hypothetical protein ACFQ51_22720 [Streptomyces kaempferi]